MALPITKTKAESGTITVSLPETEHFSNTREERTTFGDSRQEIAKHVTLAFVVIYIQVVGRWEYRYQWRESCRLTFPVHSISDQEKARTLVSAGARLRTKHFPAQTKARFDTREWKMRRLPRAWQKSRTPRQPVHQPLFQQTGHGCLPARNHCFTNCFINGVWWGWVLK